ncbi:MAG: four-carbon acid sugar kinase family protein [Peptoniphilaceae bacterium]|nr:hypothetical protein [Peptoniphilaceae bacterium]MCI6660407.1 hypothetical protein [Peptoniphilaceae bacterium]MDD7433354.1 four-carbon acid sugar kinase family protein [Peptoniphilaceae bacterium]MDY3076005.1 four-carbon acid sugar kinase family protein [Peptoniphilaceae bacterium]MDY3986404.1 four-carbon acid sugar kinase family protein [Peptoniphilaceae bacterium]
MRYVIIADDFTGANDTGVQLTRHGIPASVVWDISAMEGRTESIVWDTETRNVAEREAIDVISAFPCSIRDERTILYKKVDSTLRGNVRAELSALVRQCKPERIFFTPAYPEIERVVRDGILYVRGIPVLQTEFARDPICPVTSEHLSDYVKDLLPNTVLHESGEDFSKEKQDATGVTHIFDVRTRNDLDAIAAWGSSLSGRSLWVGSAGLAESLITATQRKKPALAVVGSISDQAFEQLHYTESRGVMVECLAPESFLKGKPSEALKRILETLKSGKDAVLTGAKSRADYERTIAIAKVMGLPAIDGSRLLKETLAKMIAEILIRIDVSGVYLTGGDTAIGFLSEAKCTESRIDKELEPGVVCATLKNGRFPDLSIITKAGGFGNEKTLSRALEYLKGGNNV